MKLITAVIRPSKLEILWAALKEAGVHGMTVTEVRGYGQLSGYTEIYRGTKHHVDSLLNLKIEIAALDDKAEAITGLIHRLGATGEVGDGKIFVMDLEQVIRIRTGQKNEEAL